MKRLLVPRASYFVFTGDGARVRRPRDVVTALVGLLFLLWGILEVDRLPDWAQSFSQLIAEAPEWARVGLEIGFLLSLIYSVVVFGALLARASHHRKAVRDVLAVVLITLVLVVVISLWVNGEWPYVLPEFGLDDPIPRFPVTRVALVTGLFLVTASYMTRPLRRLGWLAIAVTALAAVGLGYGSPVHTLGSFGLGMFVAGTLLAVLGTPRGYPAPDTVAHGLEVLGVPNQGMQTSAQQRWGLIRFETRDRDDRPVDVKVHGRDSFDSQLAAKVWRTLIYKEIGRTVSYSRLQAVEHEALGSLMASRAGVNTPELRAVGQPSGEIALIAFDGSGVRLDQMPETGLTDELLTLVWEQVARLHAASLTHGSLSTSSLRVVDGVPMIVDFDLCSLAPETDDTAADIVNLLFSSSLLVGVERAVRTAMDGVGRDSLVAALPYIQVPALSGALRREVDKPKDVVKEIRETVLGLTGAEEPEPVELRRVTAKRLLGAALVLLVVGAILPLFTQVDYAEIWNVLESADWVLIVLAVVIGHLQLFPQSTSTMFAVSVTLPFWPLMVLQTASQFISLAIPSSAGRVAMNAAFLRKFGLSVTAAVTQGAIDGFSGFLVQAAILIVILLGENVDLGLEIDTSNISWFLILGLLLLLVVVVVVAVLKVERLHDRIVPIVTQAWEALRVVLRQPSRAVGLLASNFVYWNVLGITLWILLGAVGVDIGYGPALFAATGASLLAGFMPVPGGVGVAEAAMTAMLATFGVDHSVAFAVTVVYRIITFYLPALEGLFGTRWLERNDYV